MLSLLSDEVRWDSDPSDPRRRFSVQRDPDIVVRCYVGCVAPGLLGKLTLDATSRGWAMYKRRDEFIVHCYPVDPSLPVTGERWAIFRSDFSEGDVIVPSLAKDGTFFYPLELPLEYILLSGYLGSRGGLLLHGCGIVHQGRGLVFTGLSGNGKTTMARLWAEHTNAIVLNDDLVFVRLLDGIPWVYGTPWGSNSATFSSPLGAQLESLYFVHHASHNELHSMDHVTVVSELLSQAFSPCFHDPEHVGQALDLCNDILRHVPVRRLGFVPNRKVITFLQSET